MAHDNARPAPIPGPGSESRMGNGGDLKPQPLPDGVDPWAGYVLSCASTGRGDRMFILAHSAPGKRMIRTGDMVVVVPPEEEDGDTIQPVEHDLWTP